MEKGIILAGLVPHPPIIVPEVGRGQEACAAQTVAGLRQLAAQVVAAAPDTVILISPHAPLFKDAITVFDRDRIEGNLEQFGAKGGRLEFPVDREFIAEAERAAAGTGVYLFRAQRGSSLRYRFQERLDHGMMVPLHYLREAGLNARLVPMAMGLYPPLELYRFGMSLQKAAQRTGRRVVLLASGDLSHRLTPDAPGGYHLRGEEFDRRLVELMRTGDRVGILELDQELIELAGECGYRPLVMLLGALDGRKMTSEVISYEGPFGVGYAVVAFQPGEADPAQSLHQNVSERRQALVRQRREGEHPLVRLARTALELYVNQGRVIDPPAELVREFPGRAGTFVSIKKHGALRGCIGTIEPVRESIPREIITNAISAGTADPRFSPVEPEELDDLVYSVDILGEPEPITGLAELDPSRYGVIVSRGSRSGLLLPMLEGIETAAQQVKVARQKAGLRGDEPAQLHRFEVVRYT